MIGAMKSPAFVLVHSPLVGPATMWPLADELVARGHRTIVPELRAVSDASPPRWRAAVTAVADAVAAADEREVVLVGHSGAGPLLPAISAHLRAESRAFVFVDAGLPPPSGVAPLAPPEFLAYLRTLTREDRLPPWSQWWPPDEMSALVPDEVMRQRIEAELPRLPLAYFEERAAVPNGWDLRPAAYLRLSLPYEPAAATAEERGWPVRRIDAGHLHTVVDPAEVADLIFQLIEPFQIAP